MKRIHIDVHGYFDLEYLCEYDCFACLEYFLLLNRLDNDEITNEEYINELIKLESKIKKEQPNKFNVGGLVF